MIRVHFNLASLSYRCQRIMLNMDKLYLTATPFNYGYIRFLQYSNMIKDFWCRTKTKIHELRTWIANFIQIVLFNISFLILFEGYIYLLSLDIKLSRAVF